jgi:hypothetical protein
MTAAALLAAQPLEKALPMNPDDFAAFRPFPAIDFPKGRPPLDAGAAAALAKAQAPGAARRLFLGKAFATGREPLGGIGAAIRMRGTAAPAFDSRAF